MTGKCAVRVAASFAILAGFFTSSFTASAGPSIVDVKDKYCSGCHNGYLETSARPREDEKHE